MSMSGKLRTILLACEFAVGSPIGLSLTGF
jgi:hypothetical protein